MVRLLLFTLAINFFFLGANAQQRLFVITSYGDIYNVNVDNCSKKIVGASSSFLDIAFTPNGKLWGLSGAHLYEIDTSNGSSTFVGIALIGAGLEALDDSTLITEHNRKLYKINTNNAKTTLIDTIGYKAVGDLVRYDNAFYMTGSNTTVAPVSSYLVKIVLNSTASSTLSVTKVGNVNHQSMALGTGTFAGTINHIVGFEMNLNLNADVIRICPYDASYTILCPSLFGSMPYGAASVMLPVQNPEPVSCPLTVGLSLPDKKESAVISPNPFTESIQLKITIEDESKVFAVTVLDHMGRTVYEKNKLVEKELNLAFLPQGIYSLLIKTGIHQESYRIVKN